MRNPYQRFAEADGASFEEYPDGTWKALDKDGTPIVCGAFSNAEAARLYCEQQDLTPATNDAILARIKQEYRPYDTMPAFSDGMKAYHLDGVSRRNPYETEVPGETLRQSQSRQVNGQAWDRGANAAMLYQRALAHLDAHPTNYAPETASPGWLVQLIRNGGR